MSRQKTLNIIRYVIGFPKTLWFNFRCLPFKQAVKLPVIVSHKTVFRSLKGKIELTQCRFGIVKIGFGTTQTTDFRYHRTILDIQGRLIVKGRCKIGAGTHLSVKGELVIGDRFNVTGKTTIICNKKITFGQHNLISWEVLIMDTDQHNIKNRAGEVINPDKEVVIGNNVWIAARTTIVKGAEIGDNIVVGAGSMVYGKHISSNDIIAGSPAKVVKEDVFW